MKSTIILAALLTLVSCGKKADFDGRKTTPNPGGNAPVTVEPLYKETKTFSSYVTYPGRVVKSNTLNVMNKSFKLPQQLSWIQGWGGLNDTAKIKISSLGMADITCFYRSEAISSHNDVDDSATEKMAGKTFSFTHCEDNTIDPTVLLDSFDELVFSMVTADNNEPKTELEAHIKIYQ